MVGGLGSGWCGDASGINPATSEVRYMRVHPVTKLKSRNM